MEFGPLTPGAPPRRRRKIGRWILLALLVLAVGASGGRSWLRYRASAVDQQKTDVPLAPVGRVVPEGTRIRVEVLNATDTPGLARQAMFAMRDAGFDVVYFGTSSERTDSSLVLDRTGHPEWAALAVRALAPAKSDARPDSARYLDLTLLVGRSWTPARKPLHP